MTDLADVSTGDIITASRANLVNDYIQDGTHKINTLSLDIGGTAVIDSSRNISNVGTVSCGAITSSGSITAQGGFTSTVDDGDNFVAISLINNDVTNNPKTINIVNATTSPAIYIDQNGNLGHGAANAALGIENTGNSGPAIDVVSEHDNPDAELVQFAANSSTFDATNLQIIHQGSGNGIQLDLSSTFTGKGIFIDHDSTTNANPCFEIDDESTGTGATFKISAKRDDNNVLIIAEGNTGTGATTGCVGIINTNNNYNALKVYSDNGSTQAHDLAYFIADNVDFDEAALSVTHDGDAGSSSGALHIKDSNANNDNAIYHETSGAKLTHAGVWTDAPSTRDKKLDLQEVTPDYEQGIIDTIKATPVYAFKTKDEELQRVGLLVDEIPVIWQDSRQSGIAPGHIIGSLVSAIKTLIKRIEVLEAQVGVN